MSKLTDTFSLACSLQAAHCELKSWRKIAKKYYQDKVSFATLCRIANSDGKWLPKDKEVLMLLGIWEPRKPADAHTLRIRREVNRMARDTKKALEIR